MSSRSTLAAPAVRGWLGREASNPLLRSAYSLMLNVVLTSGLGFGFWIAAARLFPSQTVGRDSALVASMMTISVVCQLNLSSGILRFLAISKLRLDRVVLGSYAVVAVMSAVGGAAFVLLAPRVSHQYRFLEQDPRLSIIYVAAVTAWGVFALQDSVLTALRRAPWVAVENSTFGVMKILALPLLLAAGWGHAVFIAWMIPMIMLLVPVNYFIFIRVIPNRPLVHNEPSPIERFGRRGLATFLAQDYLATILIQAASSVLPVLVVALLGSSEGAYFYIPFTIVSAFDLLFVNVASSLTVEASMASARLPALARTTVQRFRYVLGAGVAVLVAGASLILLPFGAAYVHAGTPVLRLMALASAFRALIALCAAMYRIEGRASRVLANQAAVFVLTIGLTVVLARRAGLPGVGLAWLLANGIVAVAIAPHVITVLRSGSGRVR